MRYVVGACTSRALILLSAVVIFRVALRIWFESFFDVTFKVVTDDICGYVLGSNRANGQQVSRTYGTAPSFPDRYERTEWRAPWSFANANTAKYTCFESKSTRSSPTGQLTATNAHAITVCVYCSWCDFVSPWSRAVPGTRWESLSTRMGTFVYTDEIHEENGIVMTDNTNSIS